MNLNRAIVLQRLLVIAFALFVFGSTFSIALAQSALGLSLVLFLIVLAIERHNPFPRSLRWVYIGIGCYIGWLLLTSLLNDTPLRSVLIVKEEWLFCIIPIGIYALSDHKRRRLLIQLFAVGVLLVSIYGIIQHFTGINLFKSYPLKQPHGFGYYAYGGFTHALTFGNFIGTTAVFLLAYSLCNRALYSKRATLLLLVSGLIAIAATIFSYRRMVLGGMVLALLLLGLRLGRKYFAYALGVVAVVAVVIVAAMPGLFTRMAVKIRSDINGVYEGGRMFIWKNSWQIIQEHPVFGVGQGNFHEHYRALLRPDIPGVRRLTHAHNDVLNVAAIAGLPGAAIYVGLWLVVALTIWRGHRAREQLGQAEDSSVPALLGSLVFFVTSLTEATFADEEVRQLLMLIWAVGLWPLYNMTNGKNGAAGKSA